MKDNEKNLENETLKSRNPLGTIEETSTSATQSSEEIDFDSLTPWQKENLKYLQEAGQEPKWLEKPETEEKTEQLSFEKKNLEELTEINAEKVLTKEEQKIAKERASKMEAEKQPKNQEEDDEKIKSDQETLTEASSDQSSTFSDNILDFKKILKEAVADEHDLSYESEVLKNNSFADKLPKIKQQRRNRMLRRLLLLLSMFLVVLLLTAYYVSPYSKVQTLEIVGNNVVTKQEIATATGIRNNEFFWNAYLNEPIEKNIKKALPRIKSVEKSIVNVNNIKLKIEEYDEIAYAKFEGKFYPILASGKIIDEAVTTTKNEAFTIFTNFENDKQFERVMNIYLNMDDEIKKNLDEVVLNPSGKVRSRIVLRMKDGNQVIGSVKDLGDKIVYYPQIVKEMSEPGVIDMEAGIFSYSYESKEASEKLAGLDANDGQLNEATDAEETGQNEQDEQENPEDSENDDELIDELQNNP
ncbi:cell division protein FtsQ/DivIB [Vagococcus zengguangii]|uniref:Cell division protein DivIB n=1 Tax=Vagococcus zengguangii TaxID=2571750 RepID=A0A4D7CRN9_9ENTE|nr:cell division protein FtsQ/DivIB [Vagococcus zengguangii]QCI86758.1 FtsQ-type POTRA domain-containing protein [Vagococcus zengguangii]TLG79480.1 FtsQ-type POTRA domain-containing protein [Vagococcus zengguangii]